MLTQILLKAIKFPVSLKKLKYTKIIGFTSGVTAMLQMKITIIQTAKFNPNPKICSKHQQFHKLDDQSVSVELAYHSGYKS